MATINNPDQLPLDFQGKIVRFGGKDIPEAIRNLRPFNYFIADDIDPGTPPKENPTPTKGK